LYGCETLSLTLREEHIIQVFEYEVLRKIFELKSMKYVRNLGYYITMNLVIYTGHLVLLG